MTKTQIITFISIILIASVSIVACNQIVPPEIVSVESFKINTMTATGGSVDLQVKIRNENRLKFTIVDSKINVLAGNSNIGTAKIMNNVVIKKKSEDVHLFKVEIKIDGISGVLAAIMSFGGGKKDYNFVGDIKVRSMGISKKVPIEFSHSF